MKRIWYVTEAHEYVDRPDTAVLKPVSWFKVNPAYAEDGLGPDGKDWPEDAFVDARPGETGAEFAIDGPEIVIEQDPDDPLGAGVHVEIEIKAVAYAVLP